MRRCEVMAKKPYKVIKKRTANITIDPELVQKGLEEAKKLELRGLSTFINYVLEDYFHKQAAI